MKKTITLSFLSLRKITSIKHLSLIFFMIIFFICNLSATDNTYIMNNSSALPSGWSKSSRTAFVTYASKTSLQLMGLSGGVEGEVFTTTTFSNVTAISFSGTGSNAIALNLYYSTDNSTWNAVTPSVNVAKNSTSYSTYTFSDLSVLSNKTVYLKFRTSASSAYLYSITITTSVVSPSISTPSPTSLSGFTTPTGTASASQTFTVGGSNLTADLVVTAPTNYEVRENGTGTFGSSVSFTPSSGTVATKTIEVRIAASAGVGTPSGNVACTSTNATTQNVAVSGTVNAASSPVITATGTINAFPNTVAGSTSSEQSYTLQGANLTGDIIVTPPTGFQISKTSGSGFVSNPNTLTFTSAEVASAQNVYVRFAPSAAQAYSGNITHTSTGAAQVDKAVSGTGVKAEPTNHATSFIATANSTSQITVTWTDATGAQVPDGYLVVASTGTPAAPVDGVAQSDAALVKNITQVTQTAVFTGLSASTTYNFSIWSYTNSGTAIDYKLGSEPTTSATTETPLGVAVATSPTVVTSTGFTANWNAAAGATGYDVNVYTKSVGALASDLFISEYGEGSSNNKYIEIFNGTGSSVDLSNYTLKQAYNGGGWDVDLTYTLPLSGTLANNDVFVITNSTASQSILDKADLILTYSTSVQGARVASFTGNDAIGLFKNSVLIDVFGEPTNSATISVAGFSTYGQDHTIVRKSTIVAGNTNWTNSSGTNTTDSEWTGYAQDTWTYLGSHILSGGSTNTPISGSPFSVANVTSKIVTGLTPGTNYYYTVVAKKGAESAAASNEISAPTLISTFTGTGDWTEAARWNTASVPSTSENVIIDGAATISSNVEVAGLTINATKSLSVNAGKQLTVSGALTNNGTLNLLSTSDGTATLIAGSASGTGTTNVSQYLSSARNWYVSSPVAKAVAPAGFTYYQRDEAGSSWTSQPFVAGNTFKRGKGYIALPGAAGSTLTFSGQLNVADTTVALTWSGTASKGFNLIGNPYPCHLTWAKAFTDANASLIEPSIYYRTNSGTVNNSGQWSNPTYNAFSGASVGGATGVIPPMQAVWVRAIAAGDLVLDNKLTRSHQSSNPMKSRAEASSQNLRLVVSDGTYSDEMLIYFNTGASNAYDAYDSPKMINGASSLVPDMYTMVGNEELVINGMSTIPAEIPLYIKPNASTSGQFSLSATEVSNFESGTLVYIKNNKTGDQQLISDGSVYKFDVTGEPSLSIIIKAPGAVTGTENNPTNGLNVYANAKGQITVTIPSLKGGEEARVYNSSGQCILNQSLTNSRTMLNKFFTAGVYVVKVNETIRKVVVE